MLIPVVAAALIFGGFVLADKFRKAKLVNAMTTDDSVEWVEVEVDGKKYLVGSDYYGGPLSTGKAATIARAKGWILPSPRIVDAIYEAADVKLTPITAGDMGEQNKGADKGQYSRHAWSVNDQLAGRSFKLLAGHSKDVVFLKEHPFKPGVMLNKLGIYGWHKDGKPIQAPMWGHSETYEDYSQRLRPVREV